MRLFVLDEAEYNALVNGKSAPCCTWASEPIPYTPEEEEKYIPKGMRNELALMTTSCKLTEEEVEDLKGQIIDMGRKGFVHYIIHTNGRGEPSIFYPDTGDRFWECGYLYRAHTQAVFTGFNGNQKNDFAEKGMLPLLHETRSAELAAGEPKGDVPEKMLHQLELMAAAFTPKLTPMDIEDLKYQIKMMRGKDIDHYIIHTWGRNYFPQTKRYSGDRYWECMDDTIGTSLYGRLRTEFEADGMEELFYENLL